jgi:hypothetical protein
VSPPIAAASRWIRSLVHLRAVGCCFDDCDSLRQPERLP